MKSGKWDIEGTQEDKKQKDAMAARGYWQAFKSVKRSIGKILEGQNAGEVAGTQHSYWYREMFGPSVTVGLLKPSDLAGYRNHQVYISQSKHTPMNKDAVRDVMPILFELLEFEEHPGVSGSRSFFLCLYTPIYGRKWTYGTVSNECHVSLRGIPMDGDSG